MVVMKLPLPGWINSLIVLVANIGVFIAVLNILGNYFRREEMSTKRSFEPKSLIGTMQPVNTSSGD